MVGTSGSVACAVNQSLDQLKTSSAIYQYPVNCLYLHACVKSFDRAPVNCLYLHVCVKSFDRAPAGWKL